MKEFYYNILVNKDDLADRREDIENISKLLKAGKKIALYAPRRYGKSSLAKNILPDEIKKKNFVALYFDFMGVQSIDDVCVRLSYGISQGLSQYLPAKNFFEGLKKTFKNMAFSIEPDTLTGEISFSIATKEGKTPALLSLLKSMVQIAETYPCLFLFDEFQDIHFSKDILGQMRSELQKLKNTPMVFLGSKRQLLSQIFQSNHSAFFQFADEYVLKPIPAKEWEPFFEERLKPKKIKLTHDALVELMRLSLDVPNTICEIGSYIQGHFENQKIDQKDLLILIKELLESKAEGFHYQIQQLTESERKVLAALAINGWTKEIQSKKFQAQTNMSLSGIKKVISKLYHLGIIEEDNLSYRVSNPLLGLFLQTHRR